MSLQLSGTICARALMLVIVQPFNPWPSGRNRITAIPKGYEALEKQRARRPLNQNIYEARPRRSGPDPKSRWSCPRAA